jgi:Fe-S cluster assembly protein SufD
VTTDAREHYLARFAGFEEGQGGSGPAWLQALRKDAIHRFGETGFPTTALEDWRYTNLAPVARTPFELAEPGSAGLTRADIERLSFPVFACSVFVFVNGRFAPELSAPRALSGGIQVGSLAAALQAPRGPLESSLGSLARADEQALVALNTAFFSDGVLVHVPAGATIEAPIHVVHLSVPGTSPTISHPRTLVVAERGGRATVIEDFVSLGAGRTFTNAVSEVLLGEGAEIEHVTLQREHEDAAHLATVRVRQQRDSRYKAHGVSLGAALTRNDVVALLDGTGAECELNGFYVASGRQHVDNHTTIDHAKPHGTSREYYKGVLDEHGRGVFNGKVIVRPDAQKTSAQQTNKNLLLSRDAEIDSKPQLEIFADDVRCSHGSTIGQIDEEAMFYLRSRGIDEASARSLLMRAFSAEITARISVAPLRERIDELLLARLTRSQPVAA